MPCGKYESKKQKALCFATRNWTASPTDEWKNWDDIIHKDLKVKVQTGEIKLKRIGLRPKPFQVKRR